jgi:hypothetical protein
MNLLSCYFRFRALPPAWPDAGQEGKVAGPSRSSGGSFPAGIDGTARSP